MEYINLKNMICFTTAEYLLESNFILHILIFIFLQILLNQYLK